MPPPQHLLASKIRGFVCRSCLLKLHNLPGRRVQWVSRNFTVDNGPTRQKGASELPKNTATDFEEAPDAAFDGSEEYLDDESILEALEEEIRNRRIDTAEHGPSTPGGVPKAAVKYFEETPDGIRTELQDHLDDEATLDALEREIGDMKSNTGEFLEGLIAGSAGRLSTGPGAATALANDLRAQLEELDKVDLKNLSEGDRSRLREVFLKNSEHATPHTPQKLPTTSTYEAMPQSAPRNVAPAAGEDFKISIAHFPVAQQSRIHELNEALRRPSVPTGRKRSRRSVLKAQDATDAKHVQRAWKAYTLSRNALMSSVTLAPDTLRRTWTILWNIFQTEGPHNMDRMARIKTLGDDMGRVHRANYVMRREQRLLYIEATFIEESQDRAIEMWENTRSRLSDGSKEYWELGARMLAQHGQPDKALKAAESCIDIDPNPTAFRILLPIIRAYLDLNTKASVKHAWALYIRLRVALGPRMTMEDYDAITSAFLAANQPDLALGAFKDMMLTGQSSLSDEDSTALYKSTTGQGDTFNSIAITCHELEWQDSRTLSKLPARFNNKFFFGSWIKKLIGDGELKAAQQVLELMNVRGIQPSAIQVNGLIGAWFREGSERSRNLAEDMAWRMIKARTDFVQQRDSLKHPLRMVATNNLPSSKSVTLTPPATIETFCVLISQYRRRQKADRLSDLLAAFKASRIQPNTHFMNELLLTNARTHDKESAIKTYQTATEEEDVPPDYDTYRILWELLKKEVDPITAFKKHDRNIRFQKCRSLFADMIAKLSKPPDESFPRDLYQLIVQSFSLAQDLPGTAVALRALQQRFEIYPEPKTARIIVLQLARLDLVNNSGHEPRRLNLDSSVTQARIANVTSILQGFKDQRVEALRQQGVDFNQLKDDVKLEEPLMLLSDLLRFAAQHAAFDGKGSAAEQSKKAAEAMGVPNCIAWVSHE